MAVERILEKSLNPLRFPEDEKTHPQIPNNKTNSIPPLEDLGGASSGFSTIGTSLKAESAVKTDSLDFAKPFLLLLLAQGFFAGLVIGKISEGRIKYGLKHSFILVALAWLISTGANLVLG